MKKTELDKLKVGDRVIWSDENSIGSVIEVGYCAAKIKWDDDEEIITLLSAPNMHRVELA